MIISNTCFGVFRVQCDECKKIESIEYQSGDITSTDEVFTRCLSRAGWSFSNIYCRSFCPECSAQKENSHD